jgi:hypothetical protein
MAVVENFVFFSTFKLREGLHTHSIHFFVSESPSIIKFRPTTPTGCFVLVFPSPIIKRGACFKKNQEHNLEPGSSEAPQKTTK